MEQVRLGIIGIGGMGTNHVNSILRGDVPEMRLTAVADIRQCRLDWARETLPPDVSVFADGRELIDSGSCDAVLIATPHYFHPEYVIYALEHGVHGQRNERGRATEQRGICNHAESENELCLQEIA